MKVFAVYNPKGGVGKTTTMENMAAIAANKNKRSLVIDLDPNLSLTKSVGINVSNPSEHVSSLMFSDSPRKPSSLAINTEHGFDIVMSGADLITAEKWLQGAVMAESRLATLFDSDELLNSNYDYVFLDIGGRPGPILNAALFAANYTFVPLMASKKSVDQISDISSLYNEIRRYQELFSRKQVEAGLFFNIVDENTIATMESIDRVLENLDNSIMVCNTVIPKSTVAEKANLAGKILVNFAPKSKLAERYYELYEEVIG